jgi:hypothetical protein
MNAKLTLRMDERLIRKAKAEARRRGKSVSQMAAEFFQSLDRRKAINADLPPITKSLVGALRGRRASKRDYKRYLKEKYL